MANLLDEFEKIESTMDKIHAACTVLEDESLHVGNDVFDTYYDVLTEQCRILMLQAVDLMTCDF